MPRHHRPAPLPLSDQIDILLEEYGAMYGLASYRLSSLERRVPVWGAALTAFVGGLAVSPPALQIVILVSLPVMLYWFVRTTVNHARSLEDILRRIDEIEVEVNRRAGENLLTFQSSHPSRGRAVGGRVGTGTVWSACIATVLLLSACMYLLLNEHPVLNPLVAAYGVYVIGVGAASAWDAFRLSRYTYRKSASGL